MTNQEKQEIALEVMRMLGTQTQKKPNARVLSPTYHKWFIDENGDHYKSPIREVFHYDGVKSARAWDLVRQVTCGLCGVTYVNQIKDADRANMIADKLCQTIYDLGKADRKTEPRGCDADCNEDCAECAEETRLWKEVEYEPQTERVETMSCQECKHWKYIAKEWQCETEKCQGYEPKEQMERSE